ncbi:unnamed protein product [Brassicogethes aeneus]|uniref:Major facilitator superfamily (MFS) profile domain-containing protein n=1 Tax=Brassicogethes aeneus TaxID=1431903 RepID=A0A9P0B2I6_BRAAE|nr:unnamed protein product [Brassicogethes aeneus]
MVLHNFLVTRVNEENFHQNRNKINNDNEPADFEKAISATKWGKFNILLYIIAIPAGWSSIFETTTMSYVFPAAQCDLDLTLENKGFLNSVTYLGMISSAFIWGFLCDTLGRKKLLCIGLLLDSFFVLMTGLSQNYTTVVIGKFLGGFIINGPFAALTCYVSEFHCAHHRARVQMVLGIIFSCGTVVLPLLAWGILTLGFDFTLGESFKIHSWNIYLFICAVPALISGVCFMFMPETPKFLMTTGNNQKALEIFQKVYSLNTGKPMDTYPVKLLVDEVSTADSTKTAQDVQDRSKSQVLKDGFTQLAPLFSAPYLCKILLVCSMQFLFMMSLNTLRLWLPQLFQAINDYQTSHNGGTSSLCEMIESLRPSNVTVIEKCEVNLDNFQVYINSMVVAFTNVLGYVVVGTLINILGKKRILNIFAIIGGLMGISLYFAQNVTTTLLLAALYTTFASVCVNIMLAVVVDLFPTTLRTMCVSLTMMTGRMGPMIGNLVFPYLLASGCESPFFFVGCVLICCAFLSCVLPNTDLKSLK